MNKPHIMVAFGIDLIKHIITLQREAIDNKESIEWVSFLNELAGEAFWWEMSPIKTLRTINHRIKFYPGHKKQLNGIKELIIHMYTRHPEVPDRVKDKIVSLC